MASDKVVPQLEHHTVVSTGLDATDPETFELIRQAQEADAVDHSLTIKQAIRKYKKAVFWAMFLSTSLIMEGAFSPTLYVVCRTDICMKGYDVVVVNNELCSHGITGADMDRYPPSMVKINSGKGSGQSTKLA